MAYATLAELQTLVLKGVTTPNATQMEGLQRALDEAAEEIDWELGYSADNPAPVPPPQLVVGVNLDRAVEHWQQQFSPFGVMPMGNAFEPIVTARNPWYRHARKLAPLRQHRGIA